MQFVASRSLNNHVRRCILLIVGQIIGVHQATKTTNKTAETTKTELRTVRCIMKAWKDSGDVGIVRSAQTFM